MSAIFIPERPEDIGAIGDAPSDGLSYVRESGDWKIFAPASFVGEIKIISGLDNGGDPPLPGVVLQAILDAAVAAGYVVGWVSTGTEGEAALVASTTISSVSVQSNIALPTVDCVANSVVIVTGVSVTPGIVLPSVSTASEGATTASVDVMAIAAQAGISLPSASSAQTASTATLAVSAQPAIGLPSVVATRTASATMNAVSAQPRIALPSATSVDNSDPVEPRFFNFEDQSLVAWDIYEGAGDSPASGVVITSSRNHTSGGTYGMNIYGGWDSTGEVSTGAEAAITTAAAGTLSFWVDCYAGELNVYFNNVWQASYTNADTFEYKTLSVGAGVVVKFAAETEGDDVILDDITVP